jgi:phosphate-selective porin OprO/OprP
MNIVRGSVVLVTAGVWMAGVVRAGAAQGDTTAARPRPTFGAGREGFVIKSADGAFQLKVRAYVQADGRFFLGGAPALGTSTFFLRRARSITDVTLWKYFALRLAPDFGQGKVVLFDAYLDFRPVAQFGLRAGKTKPPIGLERLQSATDIRFVERGLPTNLVPNRDVGLQAIGDLAGATCRTPSASSTAWPIWGMAMAT